MRCQVIFKRLCSQLETPKIDVLNAQVVGVLLNAKAGQLRAVGGERSLVSQAVRLLGPIVSETRKPKSDESVLCRGRGGKSEVAN